MPKAVAGANKAPAITVVDIAFLNLADVRLRPVFSFFLLIFTPKGLVTSERLLVV